MVEDSSSKVVFRASRSAPRSPDPSTKMRIPGYSGYIPGAQATIEKNYFQVSQSCFNQHQERLHTAHGGHSGESVFVPNIKPRLNSAPPGEGAAKFLPGYGGFIPGQRFKFETSEGTLAKTWAPRHPVHHGGRSAFGSSYSPQKSRPKPHQDKYIIGYTGHLKGAMGEIEQSYGRVARGVETGSVGHGPSMVAPEAMNGGMGGAPSYMHKAMPQPPPDYRLPGYTGYVPRVKYTFEQRYSAAVDAARDGITGGAGFRFGCSQRR